jgi:hypothetical protein
MKTGPAFDPSDSPKSQAEGFNVASVSSCESRGVHEAEGVERKDKISKGGWM